MLESENLHGRSSSPSRRIPRINSRGRGYPLTERKRDPLLDGVNCFELKVLQMSVEVLVIENLGQKNVLYIPTSSLFPFFFLRGR